jgi:hypothetical protein
MQVEQPFIEFRPIEAPPELLDLFASLTTAEMVKKAVMAMMTMAMRRRTTMSSSRATTLFFSLFGVLMPKREKYLILFHFTYSS